MVSSQHQDSVHPTKNGPDHRNCLQAAHDAFFSADAFLRRRGTWLYNSKHAAWSQTTRPMNTNTIQRDNEVTVSCIVVNWNGGAMLRECLSSIRAQDFNDREVILVDNGSNDGSCEAAVREFPDLIVLRQTENLGFAEANNRALQVARGEFVALINNDVTLEPGWLREMVNALQTQPEAGAAACLIVQAHDPERIDSAGFDFYACASVQSWRGMPVSSKDDASHRAFGPVAAAALYRRSALDRAGGFHPEYFCYYEDTDLAVRMALWGYPTVYVPGARAMHRGSETGKARSDFFVFHLRRNVEYLYWVDMVGHLALLYLPLHLGYEMLALAGALLHGQAHVVIKAKREALANRHWIATTRRQLRRELEHAGRLGRAQASLRRSALYGMPVLTGLRTLWRGPMHGSGKS
jgi:GT2 family glycosyltransferase